MVAILVEICIDTVGREHSRVKHGLSLVLSEKGEKIMVSRFGSQLVVGFVVVCLLASSLSAAERRKPPIKNPKFDPAAQKVKLFEGIEKGMLEAKMILKKQKGTVLIENKTKQPLTVQLPPAVVGVHVLQQQQQFPGGAFPGGGFGQPGVGSSSGRGQATGDRR